MRLACPARVPLLLMSVPLARRIGWLLLLMWALVPLSASAQSTGLLPLNGDTALLLDRVRVWGYSGDAGFHQPQRADRAQAVLDTVAARAALDPPADRMLARYRRAASAPGAGWLHRFWDVLYPNGHDVFFSGGPGYALALEPVYYGTIGPVRHRGGDPRAAEQRWRNSRGVRATGRLGRVYFDTYATENQRQDALNEFPANRQALVNTAPRLGFVLQPRGNTTYDYFEAEGMVGIDLAPLDIQFGRLARRWGYGMNSLVLSSYSSPFEQLQLRATHGSFQYTTLHARFVDATRVSRQRDGADVVQPRRYAAFHRLAYALSSHLTLGFFEATVFARRDAPGAPPKAAQAHYLAPVIGVRSIQSMAGGPHNTITGIDVRWQPVAGLESYTQLALNDGSVQHLGTNHWRNQWAGLVGLHLAPPRRSAWSLYLEGSRIRPFFYASRFPLSAFAHWGDSVGHSAGPNSYDVSARLAYRPSRRWQAGLWYHRTWRGRGTEDRNVGADVRRSTDTRVADRVDMLSGIRQVEDGLDAHLGYEIGPSLFIEAHLRLLRTHDAETGTDTFVAPALGIRWNAPFEPRRF